MRKKNSTSIRVLVFIFFGLIRLHGEVHGRFLYVSKAKEELKYIFSDGIKEQANLNTRDVKLVIQAIEQLGVTGSLNYVAIQAGRGVKTSELLPILEAIERNPNWELALIQHGHESRLNIALHHLKKNAPTKESPALEAEE